MNTPTFAPSSTAKILSPGISYSMPPLEKLVLPDGRKLEYWEDRTQYRKTYHVSQKHSQASDTNDGTADAPFLTVSKAASIACAGECVLIHEGIYREQVNPAGSGRSPDEMLSFCGAPGETAVISGGEVLQCRFEPSTGWKKTNWSATRPYEEGFEFADPGAKVYMFRFPAGSFHDTNPFGMINCNHYSWYINEKVPAKMFHADLIEQKKITILRRGMIYCDGRRLRQVSYYYELGAVPGSFWVEDDGLKVHIRMPDDSDPSGHLLEYTAREQCFTPLETGTCYIKLENLNFRMCGNGFPPPQRGMASSYCGHHYIVKDCTFSDTNGIGLDLGFQCPTRFEELPMGGHLVTGCVFRECGFGGMAASACSSTVHYLDNRHGGFLVAGNIFINNCWQIFDQSMEEAALKMHHLKDSIIIGNYIEGCASGCGIWIDASNENIALRENVILDIKTRYFGLFIEASHDNIELSRNIIVNVKSLSGVGGSGIYSHNSDNIGNIRNIILGCEKAGILHKYGGTDRINCGSGNTGYGVTFTENIISHCEYAIMQPTDKGSAEGNIYGRFPAGGYLKVGLPPLHLNLANWQRYMGWDKDGALADIEYRLRERKDSGGDKNGSKYCGESACCGDSRQGKSAGLSSNCRYDGLELSVAIAGSRTDVYISFHRQDMAVTGEQSTGEQSTGRISVGEQIDRLLDALHKTH